MTGQESPQARIRVLVVDDHPIVRFGLATLLQSQPDLDLAGTAESGTEAISFLRIHSADVVLMDLRMAGLSGIETISELRLGKPLCRVIVLSSFEFDEEIHAAVKAGACGYVHKESPAEEILGAIRAVHRGAQAFPRHIAQRLGGDRMTAGLSLREITVLQLVAKGLTNKEVAKTLQLSQFTVRNHLNHISEKLEVTDRTEAIFVALQTGLITLA